MRVLLTHPMDADAAHFYAGFGFALPIRERHGILLLSMD
jgi:hypothetical protein